MALRKKGFTAKQSRRMSQRKEDAQVGSHVSRTPRASRTQTGRRGTGADSMSFSSGRTSSRAARGQVSAIAPQTSTSEGYGQYRARAQQRRYMQEVARRARRKRILIIVLIVAAIIAAGVFVGRAAYMGSVGSHMALRDSDVEEALVAPASGEAYYTLIAVELGATAQPLDNEGPDSLLLVRVDEQAGSLSVANIPGELQVPFTDGQYHRVCEASLEGDAALVQAVAKFTGVSISHFAKLDEQGVVGLVDGLGGITVNVVQAIDDPHAGNIYIPAGVQTLSGAQALVYLRADNLTMGAQDRMVNQATFGAAVLASLFQPDGAMGFAAKLDSVNSCFQTDYSSNELVSLAGKLDSNLLANMVAEGIPGYADADLGVVEGSGRRWVCTSDQMATFMAGFSGGQADAGSGEVQSGQGIPRNSFTIEVQNGSEIEGAAGATAERLSAAGFNVVEVGNAEQPIYEETLLVWQGENGREKAQMVLDAVGWGRIVDSSEYYEFETDVLVILGSDYMPLS